MRGDWPGRVWMVSSRSGTRRRGNSRSTSRATRNQCRAVAFSPDGKRIAAAGFDGTLRILDAATGREMLTIFAHNSPVTGVTFSPDGYRLASSSYDHTVRLWDATPLTSDPLAPSLCYAYGSQGQGFRCCLQSRWPLARLGQLGPHHQALGSFRQRRTARYQLLRHSRQRSDSVRSLFATPFVGIAGS